MKVGDLVRFKGHFPEYDAVGLIVKVKYANEIRWLKLQGRRDYVSEIGWKVINESRRLG